MLYVAAVLLFLLGLAHSVVGERYLLMPLFRDENAAKRYGGETFAARTLRFVWHLLTVAWWGFVALFYVAAQGRLDGSRTLSIIGITLLLSGVLPLVLTRGRHFAWAVLFLLGGLALYAASR